MTSTVLVTGGTGYVAQWCVKELVDKGYKVRITVRDAKKTSRFQFLKDLVSQDIEVVSAELGIGQEENWNNACKGVDHVLHVASPYTLNVKDPQADLVDPAVNGTLMVLKACLNEPKIKSVVITSSVAAISDCFDDPPVSGELYGPDDWNTTSSLSRNPYYYSKVLAEKAAQKFVKENNCLFKFCSMNPFAVIGPALDPKAEVNTSVESIRMLMNGQVPFALPLNLCLVDVRDVAKIHVLAMEKASDPIDGKFPRYIGWVGNLNQVEVSKLIVEEAPEYVGRVVKKSPILPLSFYKYASLLSQPKGTGTYLFHNLGKDPHFDTSLCTKELGFTFMDPKKSVKDTVRWLIETNNVKKP